MAPSVSFLISNLVIHEVGLSIVIDISSEKFNLVCFLSAFMGSCGETQITSSSCLASAACTSQQQYGL